MTASDIRVDVGEEQVIIGADCRGARISVLVDGSERVDDYDLERAFAELGREIGHYTFVGGSLLEKRVPEQSNGEHELFPDGGSKYTVPTGDDYLGVWSTSSWSAVISIGTFQCVDWRSDDDVYAIKQEHGLGLVTEPPETSVSKADDYLAKVSVRKGTVGTVVTIPGRALRHLKGFRPGEDVRAYRREEGGLTLVAARADPFADDIITDGGIPLETAEPTSTRSLASKPRNLLTAVFALSVFIHGPLDVLLTTSAWHLEANPVVIALGPWPWIATKFAVLSVATFIWWDAPRYSPRPYVLEALAGLGLIAGFGLAIVFQNLVLLLGVLS